MRDTWVWFAFDLFYLVVGGFLCFALFMLWFLVCLDCGLVFGVCLVS